MTQLVITGIGAVSPFGNGVGTLWAGLLNGATAIRELTLFPTAGHRTTIAGQVPKSPIGPTSPAGLMRGPSGTDRLSRADRFAIHATREALASAKLKHEDGELATAGLFFGSSTGGMFETERVVLRDPKSSRAQAYSPVGTMAVCAPTNAVSRQFAIGGPVETVSTACCASTMAIEAAMMSLTSGETKVAIVGGADALCELTYAGFNSLGAVDEQAARPFREDRQGLSIGEGAGVLILETLEHALARGAKPLAILAGSGSSCDAYHMTAPHPEGTGAEQAMSQALQNAGVASADIDFVNAHGTGTPHNDAAEAKALQRLFPERMEHLPVTSTKGAVGHLLGACGALEAVVTVCCLREQLVPQTPGVGPVDPNAKVDLVLGEAAQPKPCRTALSANLAFGGANAAICLRAYEGEQA